MKVRLIDDGDIGWHVQYRKGRWPFWKTAFERVLFLRTAVALLEELRGLEQLGNVKSELAHLRTKVERSVHKC